MRTPTALDSILGEPFQVLDHGFIRVIDYMGDDTAIVQAARVSYGAGTKTPSDDRALIRRLMRDVHTSPFEMCELKLHVKLPIFVARQWIRHRTANVNEASARYSVVKDERYAITEDGVRAQSRSNKQGSDGTVDPTIARQVAAGAHAVGLAAFGTYGHAIEHGVARELARTVLPLSTYTEWYWKIDLHNLLHFLHLRLDLHAQAEFRAYAEVLWRIVQEWVPLTAEAFRDYRIDAVTVSGPAWKVLRRLLVAFEGAEVVRDDLEQAGIGKSEVADLMAKIDGSAT